jgi:hypothetical protein
MKTKRFVMIFLAVASHLTSGAEFQNLTFDEGTSSFGSISDADIREYLPGWTLTYNDIKQRTIDVNTLGRFSRDGSAILNHRLTNPLGYPAELKYSLALRNGYDENLNPLAWELSQTGTVPGDAKSLWFKSFEESPALRLNTVEVETIFVGTEGQFNVFAADIRGFAGKSVTLAFDTPSVSQTFGIDSIRFSSDAVPEPRTWMLVALGLLLLSVKSYVGRIRSSSLFTARARK